MNGMSQTEHPELVVVQAPEGEQPTMPSGETVEQPAKVMRIGSMIKQLLEEVRQAPLDEASRSRLREIYETSVQELADGLSADLRDELDRLAMPFDSERSEERRVGKECRSRWWAGH